MASEKLRLIVDRTQDPPVVTLTDNTIVWMMSMAEWTHMLANPEIIQPEEKTEDADAMPESA